MLKSLDQTVTIVLRIDAKDAGQGQDVWVVRECHPAMYVQHTTRSVDADGTVHIKPYGVCQVPTSTMPYMPYADYVAASMPLGKVTCRPGDYVMLGHVGISGEVTRQQALAESKLHQCMVASVVKDLSDVSLGDHGMLAYASVLRIEGV